MTNASDSFRYKQALDQILPLKGDDLDSFLSTFERIVTMYKNPEDRWVRLLMSKLRCKVLTSINLLPKIDVTVYKALRNKWKDMFKLQLKAYGNNLKKCYLSPNNIILSLSYI